MTETTTKKGGVIMDPKEQELIDARVEAYLDWTAAERKWIEACRKRDEAHCKYNEAYRNCVETDREQDEACRDWTAADRKLREYRENKKAQQGGKVA